MIPVPILFGNASDKRMLTSCFQSGGPIALTHVSFSFFACHPEEKHRLEIWKRFTVSIRELIPDCDELSAEVDTSDSAAKRLHQMLRRLSFMYTVQLVRNREGYLGIDLYTMAGPELIEAVFSGGESIA